MTAPLVPANSFGARVFRPSSGTYMIYQTVRRNGQGNYVIDKRDNGEDVKRIVPANDPAGLAEAIDAATTGQL
jgi:hypothetical protein